jgi:YggT family protein
MDRDRETQTRPQSWRDRSRPTGPAADGEPADGPVDGADAASAARIHEVERRGGEDRRVVDEPVTEERRVEARRERDRASRARRADIVHRVTLGVDYLFYLLYGLLSIRFVLSLLGAAETAGFVQFIHGLTNPFYAPFSGIVGAPPLNGGVLDFPLVIALLAYVLLHIAIRGLLRLLAGDKTVP